MLDAQKRETKRALLGTEKATAAAESEKEGLEVQLMRSSIALNSWLAVK